MSKRTGKHVLMCVRVCELLMRCDGGAKVSNEYVIV